MPIRKEWLADAMTAVGDLTHTHKWALSILLDTLGVDDTAQGRVVTYRDVGNGKFHHKVVSEDGTEKIITHSIWQQPQGSTTRNLIGVVFRWPAPDDDGLYVNTVVDPILFEFGPLRDLDVTEYLLKIKYGDIMLTPGLGRHSNC